MLELHFQVEIVEKHAHAISDQNFIDLTEIALIYQLFILYLFNLFRISSIIIW